MRGLTIQINHRRNPGGWGLLGASSVLSLLALTGCVDNNQYDPVTYAISATVLSPLEGADFYQGQPLQVSGRVSDPNPGGASSIEEVTVAATIGSVVVYGHPTADGTFQLTLPTEALDADQSYALTVEGTRPEISRTEKGVVEVDILPNLPPQGELVAPSDSLHLYAGNPTTVRFQVSDAETRYDSWQLALLVDGVPQEDVTLSIEPQDSDYLALTSSKLKLEEGNVELGLQVVDGYGKKVTIRHELSVGPPNSAPGPCDILFPLDGSVLYAGQSTTLSGSAQDIDQAPESLTYTWTLGQNVVAQGSPSATGSINTTLPGGLAEGGSFLTLTVSDELGAVCEVGRNIDVRPANGAPQVDILYPATDLGSGAVLNEEQDLFMTIQVSDAEDLLPPNIWLTEDADTTALDLAACDNVGESITGQGVNVYDYECAMPAVLLNVDDKDQVTVYAHALDSFGAEGTDRVLVNVRPCVDHDGDGYSNCKEPECDDDATVNPGVTEICDSIDNNCDGKIDTDAADRTRWYRDYDADLFGTSSQNVLSCSQPTGYVPFDGDCNDKDSRINPNAREVCGDFVDNNCDGRVDEATDEDHDGFIACNSDCDDKDPARFPGNPEVCDGKDNDCDGTIPATEVDADKDGFPSCAESCDNDPEANPGKTEVCNGKDDNCDGVIPSDELDSDGDGAINCLEPACADDPTKKPGAAEICDGLDNDCDGMVDEGMDHDLDGYVPCTVKGQQADCNDNDASIHPNAPEECDGVDSNCDGKIDTEPAFDADQDGVASCMGDCDDHDSGVKPGQVDVLNGKDDDCNGELDNTLVESSSTGWYLGEGARHFAGLAMANLGDINGDGKSDYAVGVPRYGAVSTNGSKDTTGNGRLYIFLGDGKSVAQNSDFKTASVYITGEAQEDELGSAVAALGDVNGDGLADFAVGARFNRDSSSPSNPAMTGATYIVFGCSAAKDATCFKPVSYNSTTVDNGDGTTSTYTTPRPDPKELQTLRYIKVQGEQGSSLSGSTLGTGGDLNKDGKKDVLIGAPAYQPSEKPAAGAVYVLMGRSSFPTQPDTRPNPRDPNEPRPAMMSLTRADYRVEGGNQYDNLGTALPDHAGDFNGDGYADLLLGAPNSSSNGRTYLIRGGSSLQVRNTSSDGYKPQVISAGSATVILQGEANAAIGEAVAWSDLNGDGKSDALIGAPDSQTYDGSLFSFSSGRVYVMFGRADVVSSPFNLELSDLIIEGDLQPEQAGTSLSGGGDFNGDGYEDLLIGAPGWSTPDWTQTSFRGRAYLLLGRPDLTQDIFLQTGDMDASFAGGTPGASLATDPMNSDRVGTKVAMLGDLYRLSGDQGTLCEILISTPYFDTDQDDRGKVYVISGKALP